MLTIFGSGAKLAIIIIEVKEVGRLTTHVLDTAQGCPATNVVVSLYRIRGHTRQMLKQDITNQDGRLDTPMLNSDEFTTGEYELVFLMGDYFRASTLTVSNPPFIDRVVLRFGIGEADQHYHVPLLVSPWSYSTYRGS
jgi:5-hydroxyisourate hydrolase